MASFRKIGSVWQYRVRYKREDAEEWLEVSKSGFKTKKEAQLAAANKERELLNGIEQGDMNFALYMNEWLAQYVKDKKRPNTYRTYRNAIEKHAIPRFGHMDLKDVKPMMYQKFIDSKIEEGLSAETARRIHNAVYQAYKRAVINGYLEKNPCEHVQISKREVKRLKYLEPELVPLFLKEAYKRGQIYGLFFKMLFETGMRKGEAAALQWSDINWKDGTIHIQRSLDFQPEEGDELFGQTKTYHSDRIISVRPSLLSELQAHLKYQNERKLHLDDLYFHELNLILCRDDGSHLPKSTLFNAFDGCLKKIDGPKLPIHSTRHTHAVMLLEAGADMKMVQERLGHGSMQITSDVYAHVSKKMESRSLDRFDSYMQELEES